MQLVQCKFSDATMDDLEGIQVWFPSWLQHLLHFAVTGSDLGMCIVEFIFFAQSQCDDRCGIIAVASVAKFIDIVDTRAPSRLMECNILLQVILCGLIHWHHRDAGSVKVMWMALKR